MSSYRYTQMGEVKEKVIYRDIVVLYVPVHPVISSTPLTCSSSISFVAGLDTAPRALHCSPGASPFSHSFVLGSSDGSVAATPDRAAVSRSSYAARRPCIVLLWVTPRSYLNGNNLLARFVSSTI